MYRKLQIDTRLNDRGYTREIVKNVDDRQPLARSRDVACNSMDF